MDNWTRRRFLQILLAAGASAAVDWTRLGALASEVKNKADFPVVVIGAGNGGLVAAAYLAKHGFPVTLLEQHELPGGYATSFDRAEGKFRFEVSLHSTVAEGGMPQHILTELGVWDKIKVVQQPDFCRIITPGHDLLLPPRDPEKVKQILAQAFPREAKGIKSFIDDLVQVNREMSGKGGKESIMERLQPLTLTAWMDRLQIGPEAQTVLSVFWGYYGVPPSRINALCYAVATGEYLVKGGQYYQPRSQDLSYAIMEVVTDKGGKVLLETQAGRIEIKAGAITGVLDVQGRRYPARAVIANANVPSVFGRLIQQNEVPDEYLKKLSGYHPSLSSFVVWLGLKREIKGVDGYEIFLKDQKTTEEDYEARLKGRLDQTGMAITLYDNLFHGYSRPGTSTVTIMTLSGYEYWKQYEKDYFAGRKRDYKKTKERLAKALIEKTEARVIPKLKSMIEVMEVGTPLTNVRFTGNPQGSIYGYIGLFPRLNQLDVRTPIKGLYLASAWTHGGGYSSSMMAGRDAVQAFLEDWKKT